MQNHYHRLAGIAQLANELKDFYLMPQIQR